MFQQCDLKRISVNRGAIDLCPRQSSACSFPMSFSISPIRFVKFLGACVAVLVALHIVMVATVHGFGGKHIDFFDLNAEQNLPTLFSTLQLLLASGLLLLLGLESRQGKRGESFYWLAMAFVFAYLATDEFCEIHEKLVAPLRRLLHAQGALGFAWVIPYSAVVLIFGALFARFWWRLPSRTRVLFAVAGVGYVGGALGMEMVGSYIFTKYGWTSIQFDLETLVEEFMEMASITLFVFALAEVAQSRVRSLAFHFTPATQTAVEIDELIYDAIQDDASRRAA